MKKNKKEIKPESPKKLDLDAALQEVSRKLRPEAAFTGITVTEITGCPCCDP